MTTTEQHSETIHHICPYCGEEHDTEFFSCCGEYGHLANLTEEQYQHWIESGCYIGDA